MKILHKRGFPGTFGECSDVPLARTLKTQKSFALFCALVSHFFALFFFAFFKFKRVLCSQYLLEPLLGVCGGCDPGDWLKNLT